MDNCQANPNSLPLLMKIPIGKHQLEVRNQCKYVIVKVTFADGREVSRKITLVDTIPSLSIEDKEIKITDIFNPIQDSFETEIEFKKRQQFLLDNQSRLLNLFNQLVQKHEPHYQAGIAYLDKDNYNIKNNTFPVSIEWRSWANQFELPVQASITATQSEARRLWHEGSRKPVYIYMGMVGEQVRVNQQILIGLEQEWVVRNPLPTHLLNTLRGHKKTVYSVDFSPDGKILASGSRDNTVKLWNMETKQEISTLQGHGNSVFSVAISPQGNILASGSKDRTIKLWDLNTNQVIRTWRHKDGVRVVTFSHDGRILASGSYDGTIKLWEVKSGRLLNTIDAHREGVLAIAFAPDDKIIASGGKEEMIKLWNVTTRQLEKTIRADGDRVWALAFNPDGFLLAAGSGDNSLKIWETKTGNELHNLQGHGYWVLSLAFSQDGRVLASGSSDSTIRLWEVNSGNQLDILQQHGNSVFSVTFSPDGRFLASGSKDETVKLWGAK
ncbi:MAG: WD40 repeat domain-containing protein [Thioploca sp.]|nr:WD40 repeat domain-containing protein [Thioploca sp.]